MKKILIFSLGILMLSACTSTKIADLSIVIPQQSAITQQNLHYATIQKNITGIDETKIFFIFPIGAPTLQNSIDNALKKGNGNVMMDMQIISKTRWYVLWGYKSIEVKGNVIKINQGGYYNE